MKGKFDDRKHDLEGRKLLEEICQGCGLDVGSADRPLCPTHICGITTVDIDKDIDADIVADMSDMPIRPNSQDFIVCSHALEHVENTIDVLKEFYRVLKDGGHVGILVPHGEYVNATDLGDSEYTHKQLFTEKTLELYLQHVGFKEVNVRRLERPLAYKQAPAIIAFAQKWVE